MPSFLPQVIYTFHFIIYNECFVCLGVRFNGAIVCVSAFFVIVLKAERFFNFANFGPLGRKINKTHF